MQQEGVDTVAHMAPGRAFTLYLVAGLVWFGAGDIGLPWLVQDREMYVLLQRSQDYIFVLLSGCYAAWLMWRIHRGEKHRASVGEALAKSEERLRLALEGSGSGMWDWDLVQGRHTFSPNVPAMLRYQGSDFDKDFQLLLRLHPKDANLVRQQAFDALHKGLPFVMTVRVLCFDGQYRWFEARGNRYLNEQGKPIRLCGIVADKTQQREEEDRLRLAATVVDNTSEGIVVTDANSQILSTNPAFSRLMGYEANELIGKRPSVFKSGRHGKDFYDALWDTLNRTGHWSGEIWNKRKSGEIFPERMSLSAVKDASGKTTHYVCMFTDISEEKRREKQLEFLAHRDALTGLPNRAWFMQELTCITDTAAPHTQQPMAAILLNLDRFKDVNDSYGHAVGDEVLRHIARQVQSALRPGDLIARMAGDEIVVLARALSSLEEASDMAEQLIQAAAQPWKSPDGFEVVVSVRAGICCYPQHAQTAASLVQGAHAAVYGAKQGKGDSKYWCFFDDAMPQAAHERIALEARLRNALVQGHLQLYYQPQVDIASNRIVGCEALIRWFDPVEGMISPARFIPVAETSGLIGPLGTWVLEAACNQAQAWTRQGLPAISMAVNISMHQFLLTDIVGGVRDALGSSQWPASQLELEITESALAERPEEALQVLRKLKALGVRLAIDDFGTGYSSLAHLKRFPIDLLKIDRSFVQDIPHSKEDMAISHAVIAMGQSMDMQVLAEGVETAAQLEFLRQHGCQLYQGYYCSKPLPAAEFAALLREDMQQPNESNHSFDI